MPSPPHLSAATKKRAERAPFSRSRRGGRNSLSHHPGPGAPSPVLICRRNWRLGAKLSGQPSWCWDFLPTVRRRGCAPHGGRGAGSGRIICRDWKGLRGESDAPSPAGTLVNPARLRPDLWPRSAEAVLASGLEVSEAGSWLGQCVPAGQGGGAQGEGTREKGWGGLAGGLQLCEGVREASPSCGSGEGAQRQERGGRSGRAGWVRMRAQWRPPRAMPGDPHFLGATTSLAPPMVRQTCSESGRGGRRDRK